MNDKQEVQVQEQAQAVDATRHEPTQERYTFMPRADIYEDAEAVHVEADMPGVDENHVEIGLEKHVLTIRGRFEEATPEGMRLGYQEYHTGEYERRLALSDEVDTDAITATVKNGVLHVRLPKAKEKEARRIEVKVG